MSRLAVLLLVPFALTDPAASQEKKPKQGPPHTILYAVPLVARPGEKQKVVLRGKKLDAATGIAVEGPEEVKAKFLGARKVAVPGNYPAERVGDSEIEVELELPRDIEPGKVALRASGPGGASEPYTLLVRDGLPAVAEKEPNDGFEQAQVISIPCAVEATIKTERDVDVFRFEGKKGDKLRIEVQAARFGSPADLRLTVYDANRRAVDSAGDTAGNPDPVLEVTLPRDGTYYAGVIDANDLGGANFGYRLIVRPTK
jgi:hypothetical protein